MQARWTVLAVVCFVVAAGALVGAFTRFADEPDRGSSPSDAERYNQERYTQARWAGALGIVAAFALLGGFACLQRARRTTS